MIANKEGRTKRAPALLAALALGLSLGVAGCAGGDKKPKPEDVIVDPANSTGAPRNQNFVERLFGVDDAPNAGPCPLLGVLYDASRVVEFATPEERFVNVGYTGEINGVRGLCRYTGNKPIEMTIEIDMAFGKGPAAQGSSKTYRYWVAVTRTNVAPIAKQYFDLEVKFPQGADRMQGVETIEKIVIPRADENVSGANFEVLVGFDLTPQQLAFNRDGKRFRVDVGAGDGS